MTTIGATIRRCRVARGMSQQELGDLVGVDQAAISRLESDSLGYSAFLDEIAAVLHIDYSRLVLPMPSGGNGHTDTLIAEIRTELTAWRYGLPSSARPLESQEALAHLVRIVSARRNGRTRQMLDADLPRMLAGLRTATATDPQAVPDIVGGLITGVGILLMDVAAPDVRVSCVEIARMLAEQAEDNELLAVADHGLGSALRRTGQAKLASTIVHRGLSTPGISLPTRGVLLGQAAMLDRDPRALDEQQDIAALVDGPNLWAFGPVECSVRRVSWELQASRYDEAVALPVPEQVPYRAKRARLLVDRAAAYAGLGDQRRATAELVRAHHINPLRVVRGQQGVQVIRGLLLTNSRPSRSLLDLAHHAGLLQP